MTEPTKIKYKDTGLIFENASGNNSIVIDDSNNVGIGIDNPGSKLHLKGTGDVQLKIDADSDNNGENDNPSILLTQDGEAIQLKMGIIGNVGQIITNSRENYSYLSSFAPSVSTNVGLHFATQSNGNGEVRMTIDNVGNVGIGTNNPSVPLEVRSDANTQFLVKTASNDSNDSNIEIRGARNGTTTGEQASITLSNYDNNMGTPATHILGKISGRVSNHTTNVGDLILQTSSNGSTLSDTMVLNAAGDVKINSGKLYLPGTSAASTGEIIFASNSNNSADKLSIKAESSDSMAFYSDANFKFIESDSNTELVEINQTDPYLRVNGTVQATSFEGDGSAITGLNWWTKNPSNNSEIYYDGNVGIGRVDPLHKLDVHGNLYVRGDGGNAIYSGIY